MKSRIKKKGGDSMEYVYVMGGWLVIWGVIFLITWNHLSNDHWEE